MDNLHDEAVTAKKNSIVSAGIKLLIIAISIPVLFIIVFVLIFLLSPSYKIDYKGEFVNSSGETYSAEIRTDSKSLVPKSFLKLSDDEGRSVDYRVELYYDYGPEVALPDDMRIVAIDADSYMAWVYDKDDGEFISYHTMGDDIFEKSFYLDSEIRYVDEYEIKAINAIENNSALNELPNDNGRRNKWENYFSRLKQEYEESNNTSSKEDNV